MAIPVAKPIGIICHPTGNGAIFEFQDDRDRADATPDSPVVVWNMVHENNALARFRGFITEVSENTGAFIVTDSEISPDWPDHIDPLGAGNPVYAGQLDSYEPDMRRICLTTDEFEHLRDLAEQHEEMTGLKPTIAAMAPAPRDEPPQLN